MSATGDVSKPPIERGLSGRSPSLMQGKLGRSFLAAPATVYLIVFGVIPFSTLILYSFWTNTFFAIQHTLTLQNYSALFHGDTGSLYLTVMWQTFEIAIIVTTLALLIGYPTAFFLARHVRRFRTLAFLLLVLPLTTSYLVKIYAWRALLGDKGILNYGLIKSGLIEQPLDFLLFNRFAVGLALLSAVLPFVVLPLYASLERVPQSLLEAASDLGASGRRTFFRVLLPMTRRGILASCTLAFVLCFGDFIASQLLGGASGIMIGKVVFAEFGLADNWPLGSAMAVGVLAVIGLTLAVLRWVVGVGAASGEAASDARMAGETRGHGGQHRWIYLPAAMAFLLIYLPLLAVVIFSFNRSAAPIMPITGWTLSWYSALIHDEEVRQAFWNTLKVGLLCDVAVMAIATMAALGLRGRQFRGRAIYEAWIELPFLLPEVITGVALLAFFSQTHTALNLRTILIGHVLYTLGVAFRLIAARFEAMPPSLEEAGRDLGRGAFGAFRLVTLPSAKSALLTAALITFALSFDQTMITVLVTGTDNTLPTIMWARMRIGFTPELNALATFLLLASFVLAVPIAWRFGRERGIRP